MIADTSSRRRPLLRRQLALLLALAVAPALIFSVVNGFREYGREVATVQAEVERQLRTSVQSARDSFVHARAVLETTARSSVLDDPDAAACDAAMADIVASNRFSLALYIDAAGAARCASRADAKQVDFSDAQGFADFVRNPRLVLAVVERGAVTAMRALTVSVPVYRDGVLAGLVAVSWPAASIVPLDDPTDTSLDRLLRYALLDSDHTLILASPSEDGEGWLPESVKATGASFEGRSRDGTVRNFIAVPVLENDATLVAEIDMSALKRDALLASAVPLAAPVAMLVIAVGVAYFAIDRMVGRHIVYLSRLTRAFGQGRLTVQPRIRGSAPQEIADLAGDLAAMAARLDDRQRALAQSAERNRALLLEVHHRVKNNLQMIVSLINLEMRRASNRADHHALTRIALRVQGLSLVHEKLFEAGDASHVRLDEVIGEVARRAAQQAQGGVARVTLDLEPIVENADRATPLALFVGEAAASVAAAGADGAGAEIHVALRRGEDGGLLLSVENVAGVGGADDDGGLGDKLMHAFARQLRAEFAAEIRDGRFALTLKAPPPPAARDLPLH